MKLCIATPLYPPEPGGPATYARILEANAGKYGLDHVTVVKFGDVRGYPKLLRHAAYLIQVLKAGKGTDVILALDPVSTGFPASLAARILRKPFVVKVVGDYAWEQGTQRFGITSSLDTFVNEKRVPIAVRMLRYIQICVAKHAARVIVPSHYLKGIVTAWGIPEAKITVIYNAIELEAASDLPEAVARMPRPKVVSVGRLVPWKHMDEIIDAISMIENVSLVIAGDGPDRAPLEARAREKLGTRALLTGALPHADTLSVMRDADIFVLNSSYEGLSHVLIEALMLGKPIIATSAGGNPELITHEKNGLLIPARDSEALTAAIKRLIQDPDLAVRLGVEASAGSVRFSTDAMLTDTGRLLTSL